MKLSKCKNGKIIVRMIIALALLIFSGPLFGADLRITWNANTETDLAGYTLNYVIPGDSGWTLANGQWTYTGPFTHIVELGKVTDWTLTNATPGPYAAVLRAKDTSAIFPIIRRSCRLLFQRLQLLRLLSPSTLLRAR
jgi:hypothetical protein